MEVWREVQTSRQEVFLPTDNTPPATPPAPPHPLQRPSLSSRLSQALGSISPIFYFESPLLALSAWFLILSPHSGTWIASSGLGGSWWRFFSFFFSFLTDSPNLCWPDSLPRDRGATTYSAATGDFKDSHVHTALLPKHAPSFPCSPQLFTTTTTTPFRAPPFPSSSLLGCEHPPF